MNDFFQIIGSIASLISVPLAIYLYLKSREAKFDRLKKDIVRTLSYQIGDERTLTTFEIKTVINSKLRENRIKIDSISVSEVIEDLVTETISSPLINKDRKTDILLNLKKIYFKGELFDNIDSIQQDDNITWSNLEEKFKTIIEQNTSTDKRLIELKEKNDRYRERLSSMFAVLAGIITIITAIISFIGKDQWKAINTPVYENLKEYDFLISLIAGIFTSLVAGVATYFIRQKMKKK